MEEFCAPGDLALSREVQDQARILEVCDSVFRIEFTLKKCEVVDIDKIAESLFQDIMLTFDLNHEDYEGGRRQESVILFSKGSLFSFGYIVSSSGSLLQCNIENLIDCIDAGDECADLLQLTSKEYTFHGFVFPVVVSV